MSTNIERHCPHMLLNGPQRHNLQTQNVERRKLRKNKSQDLYLLLISSLSPWSELHQTIWFAIKTETHLYSKPNCNTRKPTFHANFLVELNQVDSHWLASDLLLHEIKKVISPLIQLDLVIWLIAIASRVIYSLESFGESVNQQLRLTANGEFVIYWFGW